MGVDISEEMISLASSILPDSVELTKIDGTTLPFPDDSVDLVFTATVLQHNTDETMLRPLVREIARVAKEEVQLFERIDNPIAGDELCFGRPVNYYADMLEQAGFVLVDTEFINIHASYLVAGSIRKGLNSKQREEGEPLNGLSLGLQRALLPLSKRLDRVMTRNRDLARLSFRRA